MVPSENGKPTICDLKESRSSSSRVYAMEVADSVGTRGGSGRHPPASPTPML